MLIHSYNRNEHFGNYLIKNDFIVDFYKGQRFKDQKNQFYILRE